MSQRLHEKVILIVGGTSGIGRSAVEACAAEGARLVVIALDAESAEPLRARLGDRGHVVVGDARQTSTVDEAIRGAVDAFGRVDGLLHVAGGSGRRFGDGPLDTITDEGWAQTIDWNLSSVFYSNRAAVRQFLRQGSGGAILNVSSVLARHPAASHFATHAYAAAKAAILGLTTAAASYYAKHNIRINGLLPGLIDTPMAQRAVLDPEIRAYVEQRQSLGGGRVGLPTDLDGAIVFLLSDEAQFITGQALAVDGGWSVFG